jgi:hypothetical protein
MRPRVVLLACVAASLGLGLLVVPAARARMTSIGADLPLRPAVAQAAATNHIRVAMQAPPPEPTLRARPVTLQVNGFASWALLDRRTGQMATSSKPTGTNSTESMIKAWIAADYLRRAAGAGQQPSPGTLAELSRMIRDSDDDAAEDIYRQDGLDDVVERMISICKLTDTTVYYAWWSRTQISARDAVRMGACVADGRAAGKKWTGWLLNEMRHVRGSIADQPDGGRWGIIDALPASLAGEVAIKNGWTEIGADNSWHVNCLAVHTDWVLAVLVRYPASLGLRYGADVCRSVTRQLLVTG